MWNAQFRRFLEYWGDQSTSGALLRVVTPECPDPSTSSNQNKKLLEGAATFDFMHCPQRSRGTGGTCARPKRGACTAR